MRFRHPVFLGDEVTARVEVETFDEEKSIYTLKTVCCKAREIVIEGRAVIKYVPEQLS